jgi:hypothetical protein
MDDRSTSYGRRVPFDHVLWIGRGCGVRENGAGPPAGLPVEVRLYPVDARTFAHEARATPAHQPLMTSLARLDFTGRHVVPTVAELRVPHGVGALPGVFVHAQAGHVSSRAGSSTSGVPTSVTARITVCRAKTVLTGRELAFCDCGSGSSSWLFVWCTWPRFGCSAGSPRSFGVSPPCSPSCSCCATKLPFCVARLAGRACHGRTGPYYPRWSAPCLGSYGSTGSSPRPLCCAGTAGSLSGDGPIRAGRAARGSATKSVVSCFAWLERIPAGAIGGSKANWSGSVTASVRAPSAVSSLRAGSVQRLARPTRHGAPSCEPRLPGCSPPTSSTSKRSRCGGCTSCSSWRSPTAGCTSLASPPTRPRTGPPNRPATW